MKNLIVILDFGSQFTHLIESSLEEIGIFSVIEPADIKKNNFSIKYSGYNIRGVILSGSSQSVYDGGIEFDKSWLDSNIPILGICYGHQLLANLLGGEVQKGTPEYGRQTLSIEDASVLLSGVKNNSVVWMSHGDSVTILPKEFKSLARTEVAENAVIENQNKNIYGTQFHPEVSHTSDGLKILSNFAINICGIERSEPWSPRVFIETSREKYKFIKNKKVLCGVSGGVDSMTMLALFAHILPKKSIIATYIDSGLMPDETEEEIREFCEKLGVTLIVRDSSKVFLQALRGLIDPRDKGMAIGGVFIREFEKIAKDNDVDLFAQGTIWSDVVESGVTKFSSQIKPHHNVAGLPSRMKFELLEPVRNLFKNRVREVGRYLGMPEKFVQKKVFPGPGFAIRIEGEVTLEKVSLVKKCTKIIEEVVSSSSTADRVWMAFAILIEAPSLGIKGDQRVENKYAIVVRAVESKNSMTANFSESMLPLLGIISNRIVDETPIGRVVYDITNKPPATIEWQ